MAVEKRHVAGRCSNKTNGVSGHTKYLNNVCHSPSFPLLPSLPQLSSTAAPPGAVRGRPSSATAAGAADNAVLDLTQNTEALAHRLTSALDRLDVAEKEMVRAPPTPPPPPPHHGSLHGSLYGTATDRTIQAPACIQALTGCSLKWPIFRKRIFLTSISLRPLLSLSCCSY